MVARAVPGNMLRMSRELSLVSDYLFDSAVEWYVPYPDVVPALESMRCDDGLSKSQVVILSNFDSRLAGAVERAGIAHLVDGIIPSVTLQAPKPSREAFLEACFACGIVSDYEHVWMVGDTLEVDCAGARSAGITPIWIDRSSSSEEGVKAGNAMERGPSPAAYTVRSLAGLKTISTVFEDHK